MFDSTFIPYDATGRVVNLDVEFMYMCAGLKLKVIRFGYYKSDDTDYNWFILAPIDRSNAIKADIYDILCNYAYDNLGIEKGKYVGTTDKNVLIQILTRFRRTLYDIAERLETHDAE